MLALATPLLAQRGTGTITGQVIDRQTTRPLVGAQVRVTGTDRGALTGEGGAYRITGVDAGTVTVAAQRIGYAAISRAVTVTPDGTTTADFGLTVSVTTLDQVIVTATGQSERKRESGVTTATIDGSQIAKAAVSTFADVLSSRSPGVVVQQAAGESGAGARIRIRGSNSISLSNEPLIIVDGIRVDNSANSTAIGTRWPAAVALQRHQSREHREHRDHQGAGGVLALRDGRVERRHPDHHEEGPRGQDEMGDVRRVRKAARRQRVSGELPLLREDPRGRARDELQPDRAHVDGGDPVRRRWIRRSRISRSRPGT